MFVHHLIASALFAAGGFGASIPSTAGLSSSSSITGVPQSYLVTYKQGVTPQQAATHQMTVHDWTTSRNNTFRGVTNAWSLKSFKAYSVHGDKATIKDIVSSGIVASIEPDHIAKTAFYVSQTNATWGLQRVSHRSFGNTSYTYDNTAGTDTFAYVLDTGILTTHNDFGGRAKWGANFVAGAPNTDDNGHGTHCAGTIGSRTYGIAKNTTLIAVKVLDSSGSGSYSAVINGLLWTVEDAITNGGIGSSVVSMSLAGGYSATLNSAVNAVYKAGIPVIVAAGNSGALASGYSPASAQYAISVGATDSTDTRASWSNYGPDITLFAPGVSILSTWSFCNDCTNVVSGTSMSTPHVAGMAAYLIRRNGLKKPADVVDTLKYYTIANIVKDAGAGTTSNLLFNGNGDNGQD